MLMTFLSLLYLSLSFLFQLLNKLFSQIMISFWRKRNSFHSFRDRDRDKPVWSKGLIGLISSDSATRRSSENVVESSAIAKPSPAAIKDVGGIGFIDDIGGGVDGLMSCTESLGFESSDERRVDDDDLTSLSDGSDVVDPKPLKSSFSRRNKASETRRFPPPISSLNQNGQPSFFLRPVRKDGRLELTEVRINRPEILRATRGDGRLRLHLIRDDEENDENCIREESEEQEEENDCNIENEKERERELVGGGEEWRFPASSSGEEGFRRCQQNLHSQHHAVWRQSHPVRRLHVAV